VHFSHVHFTVNDSYDVFIQEETLAYTSEDGETSLQSLNVSFTVFNLLSSVENLRNLSPIYYIEWGKEYFLFQDTKDDIPHSAERFCSESEDSPLEDLLLMDSMDEQECYKN
jgi:hypothetical protein